MGTSGLWQVMTPQEAVDFVHQCRQCRPDNLSCSEALTLEAHTRWKLRFSKVTADLNDLSDSVRHSKLTGHMLAASVARLCLQVHNEQHCQHAQSATAVSCSTLQLIQQVHTCSIRPSKHDIVASNGVHSFHPCRSGIDSS